MVKKVRKPARRRAKQERAHATLAVVLEAAAQVLQREGYARATTNRIAEVAGVSVGTIYQYFPNKDAIFDAVIRQEIAQLLGVLQQAVPDPRESFADALRGVLLALVQSRPDAPALYRSLEHVPNGLFRRRITDARGNAVAWVRALLAAHPKDVRVRDLDTAAFVVVAAAEGIAVNASADFFQKRGVDEVASLFTRYLMRDAR